MASHLKNKTYEEVFGKRKAARIKRKQSKKRKGRSFEQTFGIKKARKLRRRFSKLRKGKKFEEVVGEKRARKWRKKISKNSCSKGGYEKRFGKKRAKKIRTKQSIKRKRRWKEFHKSGKAKKIGKKIGKSLKVSKKHKLMVETKLKGRKITWGKKVSVTRIKKGLAKGKNNPMWKGGISYEPYTDKFNSELKFKIRKRDNFTCQLCEITEKQLKNNNKYLRKLHPHHINYKKKNSKPSNLIALCNPCNSKVNSNRKHWTKFFRKLMKDRKYA